MSALRTAYLDAAQADLAAQIEQGIRDRATVLVYGPTTRRARIAAALLTAEKSTGRPIRCTREHDRWVLAR